MKNLYRYNVTGIIITLLLYITLWGGILAQVLLGGFQLICFMVICVYFSKLTNTLKNHVTVYGLVTFLLIVITVKFPDIFFRVFWPFSGVLAFYFLYITYQLKKLQL